MATVSKDQQVKQVVEGLALGVLKQSVTAVTSGKMAFEFAFNDAWRRWTRAEQFPSIAGRDPGNLIWIGVGKSERRRMTRAAWRQGRWTEPYILLKDWTVDDCLDLHADERASAADWVTLGQLYVSRFGPEQLQHAL